MRSQWSSRVTANQTFTNSVKSASPSSIAVRCTPSIDAHDFSGDKKHSGLLASAIAPAPSISSTGGIPWNESSNHTFRSRTPACFSNSAMKNAVPPRHAPHSTRAPGTFRLRITRSKFAMSTKASVETGGMTNDRILFRVEVRSSAESQAPEVAGSLIGLAPGEGPHRLAAVGHRSLSAGRGHYAAFFQFPPQVAILERAQAVGND